MNLNITNRKHDFFLIVMLGALSTITPFSIDMYLPSFPNIANDLHTTIKNVSLSVSTYFLGFASGQILYGPLLDRFGRKIPLYIGMILYIVATVGCIVSNSIQVLLIIRFMQALSGCVASVAAMALVRDFYPPEKSASVISLLILVIGASPLFAPTAGSFIINHFNNWHYIFITLAAIVALLLVVVFFFLPNGARPDTTLSLKPKPIINVFKQILFTPQFYIFSLAGSFSFSALFVYVAASPSVFMDSFHLTAKQYGGVFALLSVGFIGGSQLNHILTKKFTNQQILKTMMTIQVVTSILFAAAVLNHLIGLSFHLIFLFVMLICSGLTYPNAAAIALAPFDKNAGSAAALLGFLQIGIGGCISSAVGLIHSSGSLAMSLTMAATSIVAFAILKIGEKKISNLQLNNNSMPIEHF